MEEAYGALHLCMYVKAAEPLVSYDFECLYLLILIVRVKLKSLTVKCTEG